MSLLESVAVAGFVGWFALLVARQLPVCGPLVRAIDLLGIFPALAVFGGSAPADYSIRWRVMRADGSYTEWLRLDFGRRPALAAVWNPRYLERRLLPRFVAWVRDLDDADVRSRHERSPHYRAFVGYLWARVTDEDARGVQFTIATHRTFAPDDQPRLVFTSRVHESPFARP